MFNTISQSNKISRGERFGVYCVHDGHSGSKAVESLHEIVAREWAAADVCSRPHLSAIEKDPNVAIIEDIYYKAIDTLSHERSGVVSVTVLIVDTAIYFAWIGDCEACIFQNDNSLKNPIFSSESYAQIDFAELNILGNSCIKDNETFLAMSRNKEPKLAHLSPHSFSDTVILSPEILWKPFPTSIGSSIASIFDVSYKETYNQCFNVSPLYFRSSSSQKEFQLAKLYIKNKYSHRGDSGNPFDDETVTLDITTRKLGKSNHPIDVRFSGAIQPTRSIGDFANENIVIIKHPSVMRFTDKQLFLPAGDRHQVFYTLLCSDGILSNGAFANLNKACRFAVSPVKFILESLYYRGQEVTERLVACGLLSESLNDDTDEFSTKSKKQSEISWQSVNSWNSAIRFLKDVHLKNINSSLFKDTFDQRNGGDKTCDDWIAACDKSIIWIEKQFTEPSISNNINSLSIAASAVVHMAVLMGSHDNVTAMIVKI
jgi:serine/threonine protein phosphatase PrpC